MKRKDFLHMAGMGLTSLVLPKLSFGNASREFPWDEMLAAAQDFVSRESPDTLWPFERPGPEELANSDSHTWAGICGSGRWARAHSPVYIGKR